MKQKQLLEIMTNQEKTYTVYNNQLSIRASLLYEDWKLMSYKTYIRQCQREKLVRTKRGVGTGNFALVSFHDLPNQIKAICIEKLGRHEMKQLEGLIIPETNEKTFVYFRHELSIPASLLYEDWKLMSYKTYITQCQRKKLFRSRMGKGKGNSALLFYEFLPEYIKAICIEKLGDPKKMLIKTI